MSQFTKKLFLQCWLESKKLFLKIVVYLTFIGSIFLLLWGYFFPPESYVSAEFIRSVGGILLTSVFFAAILKSSQFSKIFHDELREIVYSDEYLSKRSDVGEIWDKVTAAICKQKFDSISTALHKGIKEHYLPIDHDFYYKNFKSNIEICSLDEFGFVEVLEETSITLVSAHAEMMRIPFSVTIYKETNDLEFTTYEFQQLKINSKIEDLKGVYDLTKNPDSLEIKGNITVSGKKIYHITRKEKKKYKLDQNTLRIHHANWLYKNADLTVRYPNELKIKLIEMGLLKKFTKDEISINGFIKLTAKFTGLIFKNQGFILHITKK